MDLSSDDPADDLFVLDHNPKWKRYNNKRDTIKAILPLRGIKNSAVHSEFYGVKLEDLYNRESETVKWWPRRTHSDKDIEVMKQ